jgi:hypothetical protein
VLADCAVCRAALSHQEILPTIGFHLAAGFGIAALVRSEVSRPAVPPRGLTFVRLAPPEIAAKVALRAS